MHAVLYCIKLGRYDDDDDDADADRELGNVSDDVTYQARTARFSVGADAVRASTKSW